jgi:TatD DNase family protein
MFVDTHTHLDFEMFDKDRELVIQHAIENKISVMITIGVDVQTSVKAVELAEKYVPVYAAVGVHPTDCKDTNHTDLDIIKELASHEKVVALGEIGLDYYHMRAPVEKQKTVFKDQITLAKDLKLPIIVHNRESHDDVYDILKSENATEVGGVLHSFSGDSHFLEHILLTNFHISFTGAITYKKSTARPLIEQVPLERLLLETDSPFLAPVPLRGKRNEPSFLIHTAKKIAEIKKINLQELAKVTTENANGLFNFDI